MPGNLATHQTSPPPLPEESAKDRLRNITSALVPRSKEDTLQVG